MLTVQVTLAGVWELPGGPQTSSGYNLRPEVSEENFIAYRVLSGFGHGNDPMDHLFECPVAAQRKNPDNIL